MTADPTAESVERLSAYAEWLDTLGQEGNPYEGFNLDGGQWKSADINNVLARLQAAKQGCERLKVWVAALKKDRDRWFGQALEDKARYQAAEAKLAARSSRAQVRLLASQHADTGNGQWTFHEDELHAFVDALSAVPPSQGVETVPASFAAMIADALIAASEPRSGDVVERLEAEAVALTTRGTCNVWDHGKAAGIREAIAALAASPVQGGATPIPMLLFCPECSSQHVDAPTPEWPNPPHRSHLCHVCRCVWRPADVATVGVQRIETKGQADTWVPAE